MPYILVMLSSMIFNHNTTRKELISVRNYTITLRVTRTHCAVTHTSTILPLHANLSHVNHENFPGIF